MVLDVVEVVLQLFLRVFNGRAVLVAHLCPAGDTGLDAVAHRVIGNLGGELLDEVGPLGARADQAHVAAEHVEELRQFVDAQQPDDVAHPGDPAVVGRGPLRLAVFLGIGAHAAELGDLEVLAVVAHPLLAVEDRPAAFQLDGDGGQQHHRGGHQDQHQRAQDVEDALDRRAVETLVEAIAEDQPAGVDEIDADLAQHALEIGGDVEHPHARQLAVEQLTQRHAAGAALGQRHDDLVDAQAVGGLRQRLVGGQALGLGHGGLLFVGARKVAHHRGQRIGGAQGAAHHLRGLASAEDQHPRTRARFGGPVTHDHPAQDQRGDDQHRRGADRVDIAEAHRQHAENLVGEQQRHRQRQRSPQGRFNQRPVLGALVQARRAVDHEQAGRQTEDLGAGHRHGQP